MCKYLSADSHQLTKEGRSKREDFEGWIPAISSFSYRPIKPIDRLFQQIVHINA